MPILYKAVTFVLALTGCLSLVISGELNVVMTLSGIAMIPGYYGFLKRGSHAAGWAIGVFSIAALAVFAFDASVSGDVFLAVAHLTIAFQAIKSFDLKEPWDHLQVYFMSLLQLIIASELTHSVAFGAVFVVFIILLVTAMILSHFLKEGQVGKVSIVKPLALITLASLFITALFFVAVPRTPYRFLAKGHLRGIKSVGFSDKVDFGSFGNVKLDPTIVMRVEIDMKSAPTALYWRGIVLDYFDGRGWRSTLEDKTRRYRDPENEHLFEPFDKRTALLQTVYLEPLDSDVIFGLQKMKAIVTESRTVLSNSADAAFFPRKLSRSTSYKVYSIPSPVLEGFAGSCYLQLPQGVERVAGLAQTVARSDPGEYAKAVAIERFLKNGFTYSLSTAEPPAGVDPIEDFLFISKKGYCEHYATSMALMLRALGIHSRVVNGFYGGDINEYGNYIIVRQSNAHSWVEAYVEGVWRRFDPTPAELSRRPSVLFLMADSLRMNWFRYVIGFSAADQLNILDRLAVPFRISSWKAPDYRKILPFLLISSCLVMILLAAYIVATKLRRGDVGPVSARYLGVKRALRKKGITMGSSATPEEVKKVLGDIGADVPGGRFINLYETYRFGGRNMNKEMKIEYERLYAELTRKLKA